MSRISEVGMSLVDETMLGSWVTRGRPAEMQDHPRLQSRQHLPSRHNTMDRSCSCHLSRYASSGWAMTIRLPPVF